VREHRRNLATLAEKATPPPIKSQHPQTVFAVRDVVDKVCVLAFDEPPLHWGFQRSRKGTSWFIFIEPARVPRCLSALDNLGISGKAMWDDADRPPQDKKPARGKSRSDRPRGKKARTEYDGQRYIRRTSRRANAIADAALIEARKHKRAAGEEAKRRREFTRQAEQQLAREQQARADEIVNRRPHGST